MLLRLKRGRNSKCRFRVVVRSWGQSVVFLFEISRQIASAMVETFTITAIGDGWSSTHLLGRSSRVAGPRDRL